MGRVAKRRFAIVFLMVLTVGLSLGLSAEDVLDAVYDESEALPYEIIPLFSVALRPMAAQASQVPLSSFLLEESVPSWSPLERSREKDAWRTANARVSLAILCTLLC